MRSNLSTKSHIKIANHATCYTSSYEMHDGYQRIIDGRGTTTLLCSSHHHPMIFRCDDSVDHHRVVVFRRDDSAGHHNSHVGPFRHDDSADRSQRAKESSTQGNQAQSSNLNGKNHRLEFAKLLEPATTSLLFRKSIYNSKLVSIERAKQHEPSATNLAPNNGGNRRANSDLAPLSQICLRYAKHTLLIKTASHRGSCSLTLNDIALPPDLKQISRTKTR
ncbi:hypothetical protein F511_25762 [Dorcoceras hygrometricum]|uniref:Uncharacterized protein n=1 Tax=Dorcoceras hygrometricum TaxID=472368 RepID=A0A2Z7BXG8_9LAMI|nr:hypothetical protein F511_25762 [Dorcoceras hygrometricum]